MGIIPVSFTSTLALIVFSLPLSASLTVSLTPSRPSPQSLGTKIIWTAAATSSTTNPLTYRFEVSLPGSSNFSLIRDYRTPKTLNWTPAYTDGTYRMRVTARDYLAGETAVHTLNFVITSRLVGGQAIVTPTEHPLVALFSAPTCPAGSFMHVSFRKDGSPLNSFTDWRACHTGSMNFYVAGMQPTQLYKMNYEVMTGSTVTPGPKVLSFTTGAVPSNLPIPDSAVLVPPGSETDNSNSVLLTGYVPMPGLGGVFPLGIPIATNLNGEILWYYPLFTQVTRPVPGGTFLMILNGSGTGTGPWGNISSQHILREVNLTGNTVRETNADRISEQLMDMGTDPIGRLHHDAIRLPNGKTLVFGDVQRMYPPGTQGSLVPVDILGLMIVELDLNWQVTWYWNAFDHAGGGTQLDIQRPAVRGEVCFPGKLGCPPVLLGSFARDWLHGNSVQYLAADGDLLVSLRNQDWVIKIDYGNGAGTGNVLWRLGKGGDFTMQSSDPYPWFSAQHEAAFEDNGTTLSVYDNGVSRVAQFPAQHSRGQVLNVDQNARRVTLQLNADLGVYSVSLGSAQRLSNGNYTFQSGFIGDIPNVYDQSIEVTPIGTVVHLFQGQGQSFRSWRMRDLYTPPGT